MIGNIVAWMRFRKVRENSKIFFSMIRDKYDDDSSIRINEKQRERERLKRNDRFLRINK